MTKQGLFYKLIVSARISQVCAIRFFNENKKADITFNQYEILSALKNGNYYQRDLAKYLFKGTSNLSKDIKVLENKGLLKRIMKTNNNRMVKTLHLTQKGKNLIDKNEDLIENYIDDILKIYNIQEYKQFEQYLDMLKDKLTESVGMILE
ncbi:hypothetical protein IJ541_04260 [bacterium]|nr:hypothetical protein [bacterium]